MPPKPRPLADRFWPKVDKTEDCWTWTASLRSAGYGQISGPHPVTGEKTMLKAHRVAYALTHGEPGDRAVLHRCHNRLCVNPDHLYLGDQNDNMRDMALAERHWRAHLDGSTADEIIQAIDAAPRGPTGRARRGELRRIADRFGVPWQTVKDISRGKAYRHRPRARPTP